MNLFEQININKIALAFLIFIPKYSIIHIPGYIQGIRLEDFLILFLALANIKIYIKNSNSKNFNIVVLYLIFIIIINYYIGISQEFVVILRLIEYWVIYNFILLNYKYINKSLIISFIIINTIIAALQFHGLIGGFASFGYLNSGHGFLGRPYGLLSGPWELGATLAMSIFILHNLNLEKKYILLLTVLVFYIIILTATRSILIGYIIANIYLNRKYLSPKNLLSFLFFIMVSAFLVFNSNEILERYNIKLDVIGKIIQNLLIMDINDVNLKIITNFDISLSERYSLWITNIELWKSSIFNCIFGIGWHNLYMESFLIRLITTFGLIGTALILYLFRNIRIYLLIFTIAAGLTLDLFVSMKIFIFYSLYSAIMQNKRIYENSYLRS